MGYKIKWIEDNLGVTRKALLVLERMDLMPKNEEGKCREYSEDDIKRIWTIRVFQGMGFKLKEIWQILNDESYDLQKALDEKVKLMEQEIARKELHLGYARAIKLTGRVPMGYSEMGEVTFSEFYERMMEEWNIKNSPQSAKYQELVEMMIEKPMDEWQDTDLARMCILLEEAGVADMDRDVLITDQVIPKEIVKRRELGATHPEVQLLVKILYDNMRSAHPELSDMTVEQFSHSYSASFMAGDIGCIKKLGYEKEDCRFIADAVAVFGGYESYAALNA